MSRIGRLPITIEPGVKVAVSGDTVTVKGPKGEASRRFRPEVSVRVDGDKLVVVSNGDTKLHRALHGLSRALLFNMVEGVSKGFEKALETFGVGYRVQKAGNDITLQVGFSHPVPLAAPAGINLVVEGTNRIRVQGVDKELVGATAANIRRIRPPDSYKGKGIRYVGERLRAKAGKAGKVAAKK